MSTAMNVVAAIDGSAPTAEYTGPATTCTNCDNNGMAAMTPATGTKMSPIACSPSRNSFPSPRSLSNSEASAPATAQHMTTVITTMPMMLMIEECPLLPPDNEQTELTGANRGNRASCGSLYSLR